MDDPLIPEEPRLVLPDGYRLAGDAPAPAAGVRGRGPRRTPRPLPSASPEPHSEVHDLLLDALTHQEMELVRGFELEPTMQATPGSGVRPRGAPPIPAQQEVTLDLTLAAHEDAVLLVEQEGLYSWHLPTVAVPAPPAIRGGRRELARKTVTFRIQVYEEKSPLPRARGLLDDLIYSRIKAYLFKFAARIAVGQAMSYLERHVRPGLVRIPADDPETWQRIGDGGTLPLPGHRPARVLLLIHGTFSSTLGSYAALGLYPWGRAFLRSALSAYDLVLGYDHYTLSQDPVQNGADLLSRLQEALGPGNHRFDAIAYSRGGLVLRSLTELLAPVSSWQPRFENVVHVGVPHEGTLLARPENWQTLVDFYTNLTVAACKVLSWVPQAAVTARVMEETVQGIGALVKYIVTHAIDEGRVPGLMVMEPASEFLTRLNRYQPGQPAPDALFCCAVTSEFDASLGAAGGELKELPRRLLMSLADRLADQFMGEPNDLVVNTRSMTAMDVEVGDFLRDELAFGRTPHVFHTIYFTRPEVIQAFRRWFSLPEPVGESSAPRSAGPPATGTVIEPRLPSAVTANILTVPAAANAAWMAEALADEAPEFVVIRREWADIDLYYAFTRDEIARRLPAFPAYADLLTVMDLHEYEASPWQSTSQPIQPPLPEPGAPPSRQRMVVVDDRRPVGVVPEQSPVPSNAEVAEMAQGRPDPAPDSAGRPDSTGHRGSGTRGSGSREPAGEGEKEAFRPSQPSADDAAGDESLPTEPTPKQLYFRAQMADTVVVQQVASLEVIVSPQEIRAAAEGVSAGGAAAFDPARTVILDVRPRVNFEILGESRVELQPSQLTDELVLYFDLRATHLGEGEVRVVARQGQFPLVELRLKVQIVGAPDLSRRQGQTSADATVSEPPRVPDAVSQFRIAEQRNGPQISYKYELDLPPLEILKVYESAPILSERSAYVDGLYKRIEERWLSSGQDVEDFTEELREMGGELFDELFPRELQQDLWEHRAAIGSIQVLSEEPFIPWEVVHLKEPGLPLGDESWFLGQMGMVRWLHGSYFPRRVRIRQDRTRYLIPDYPHPDDRLPETAAERVFLIDNLSARPVEPRAGALRRLLREGGGFDLLHFAGHGVAQSENISEAAIMLQGRVEDGNVIDDFFNAVSVEQNARLRGEDGNRPMVLLNACQAGRLGFKLTKIGGFAQAFLQGGAGIFVGTLWSVGDSPARTFTETLYRELQDGRTLSQAADAARRAARLSGDASWLAYAVYGHPHAVIDWR